MLGLLPAAWLLRIAAFAAPETVEHWYGARVYPVIARVLGATSGAIPFSLAEPALLALVAGMIAALACVWRRPLSARQRLSQSLLGLWILAGVAAMTFLLTWGLNYARPSLAERLQLSADEATLDEIEELALDAATAAATSWAALAGEPGSAQLDRAIDAGYGALALPGDTVDSIAARTKRPFVASVLSRLGISGIYIPFTGEPTLNGDIPHSSVPLAVAHERAHQRGITDEGEANLAAILVCLQSSDPYLRYSAQLDLAARAIGALNADRPDAAAAAWERLGTGPHTDLRAVREFWDRYRGAATEFASRVNDAYLRSHRVPEGVRSYGRVLNLAIAARREGWLTLETEGEVP